LAIGSTTQFRENDKVCGYPYICIKVRNIYFTHQVMILISHFFRSPRKQSDSIYLARYGTISMKARLEAARKAEELESQLDPEVPSFVKEMLHSHVVRGFWLVSSY
jgi:hypothetical protein